MVGRVELVGASGRLRWNGHLRVPLGSDGVVCARVGAHLQPAEAWARVCALADAISGAATLEDVLSRVERTDDLALVASDGARWTGLGLDEVAGHGQPQDGAIHEQTGDVLALGRGDARPGDWA